MSSKESHICRICGYNCGEPFWVGNNPNWLICDCCGSESGYEDSTLESIVIAREKWISNGSQWFNSKHKPSKWNSAEQLINIPRKWK